MKTFKEIREARSSRDKMLMGLKWDDKTGKPQVDKKSSFSKRVDKTAMGKSAKGKK